VAANQSFQFHDVVLVADILDSELRMPPHLRRDLEKTDRSTLQEITTAILDLGLQVHHYQNPSALAEAANHHRRDIVLSIFGGSTSRNRMALVPAICESLGLAYIGPDTYGRVVCQDKEISKSLAQAAGLNIAPHRIARSEDDVGFLTDFPLPYVVKPLLEGSSIGIGSQSLVTNRKNGEAIVRTLSRQLRQPLMVEAFVPGKEVSWCFVEGSPENSLRAFAEVVWDDDPDYFETHLYDAQHKLSADRRKKVRLLTEQLRAVDELGMERLLRLVGHVGYGRVDGKFKDGQFTFLEITPDAWLGVSGTFMSSFQQSGHSYESVIQRILLSAQQDRHGQLANDSDTLDDI
jgi:D-alanine-D-alanine ligase